MQGDDFREPAILSYIGLPPEHEPRPSLSPIEFLTKYLHVLPPHLIVGFSSITTPKQRSVIAEIRNRRLAYTETRPKQLAFVEARDRWPHLWSGGGRRGQGAAQEEREWAEKGFLGGDTQQQVGKLGALLADYEEEREAERIRMVKRQRANDEFVPEEEEEDSESEMGDDDEVEESPEEARAMFERRIKELFIYGMLEVSVAEVRWLRITNVCRAPTMIWWTGASSTTWTGRRNGILRTSDREVILFWELFGNGNFRVLVVF